MGRMRSFLGFFTGLALSFFVVDAFAAGYTCTSSPKYTRCNPGYYMTPDSNPGNKCTKCPAGYYCPGETTAPQKCPEGWTSNEGTSSQDDCHSTVKLDPTVTVDSEGTEQIYAKHNGTFYLDADFKTPMTTSQNPIEIPSRTGYEFDGYAASASACTLSTTRYIDKTGHATSDLNSSTHTTLYACWKITCQAGQYLTASAECLPCTAGYYCPTKEETYVFNGVAQGRRLCSDAIGDEYTSDSGAAGIEECYINVEAGYYLAESGGAPEECTAGTYNPASSKVYYGATSSCTLADAGYYVANTGASSQTPCAAGTYTSTTGQLSCTDAVAGTYTTGCKDTTNNKACTGTSVCAANTYSDAKASACIACATSYGNSGAASSHAGVDSCKVSCEAGYYVPTAGEGCQICTAGKYCAAVSAVAQTATTSETGNVSAGYYSNGGGTSATPTAAGNGCLAGQSCGLIAGGRWGAAGAVSAQGSGRVRPGFYSSAGATSEKPNKNGDGCVGSDSKCGIIAPGYYGSWEATVETGSGPVDPGYYSAGGATRAKAINGDGYCYSGDCGQVDAGYWNNGGGTSKTPSGTGNGCIAGKSCGVIGAGYYGAVGATSSVGSGTVSGGYFSTGGGKSATPSATDCVVGNTCGKIDAGYWSVAGAKKAAPAEKTDCIGMGDDHEYCGVIAGGYYATCGASYKYPASVGVDCVSGCSCGAIEAGRYTTGCGIDKQASVCSDEYEGGIVPAGYYSKDGASPSLLAGGYYSTGGATTETPSASDCIAKEDGSANECGSVDAGYYSTGGGTSKTPSAAGDGCVSGEGCGQVDAGYWNNGCGRNKTGSVCSSSFAGGVIAAGFFGNAGATSSTGAGTTWAGHYSTGGATKQKPTSSSDCVGRKADGTPNECGLVAAEYYSTGGGTSATGTCLNGYDCGQCDANYRANTETGKTSASACQISCAKGMAVLEEKAACAVVTGSNYKTGTALVNYGSVSPKAADITGNWSADTVYACPNGYSITGTSEDNHDVRTDCAITCSAGYAILSENATSCSSIQTATYKGQYIGENTVAAGSASTIQSCPTGYQAADGTTEIGLCSLVTSERKYVEDAGAGEVTCKAGGYCPGNVTVSYGSTGGRTLCGAGKFSEAGAASCLKISAGCYGSSATSACPAECAAGTYATEGSASCSECTGRTQFSAAGAESCSTVSPGHYTTGCDSSGNNCKAQSQCTSGTYCEEGVQKDCEYKDIVASWGADVCTIEKCKEGYYLLDNECVTCPDSATCNGTAEWECDENYKKNGDGTACVPDELQCKASGWYCGDNKEAIECPEGYYCTEGQQHLCDSDYPLSAKGSKKEGDCYQSCKLYCDRISEDKWEEKTESYNAGSCSKNGNIRIAGGKFRGTSTCVLLPGSEVPTECVLAVYCKQGYYYTSKNDLKNGKCDLCSNLGGGYEYSVHGAPFSPDSKTGSDACYKVVDLMCTAPVCPEEGTGTCSYDDTENESGGGYEFYGTNIVLPGKANAFLCRPTGVNDSYFECSTGYTKKENPDIDPRDGTADKPEDLCTPTVYTMTLNANDGSDASYEVYQKYNDGWYEDKAATTKLEIKVPELKNYTFTGYYTCKIAGCAMVFDAEGNLTEDAEKALYTANMNLYAWWDANVYDCKSGFYYVGNPDGSGSEVECKTGDKFYCPGTDTVLVTGTGCMESCPVADGAADDPTTTRDGATDSTACSATFEVNPANGQELANGDATWVCGYQSDADRYSACEVMVNNCDGGYYEVSNTCAVVEGGYYSPAGETIQTQCPQKTNYKIGTDELRDAKTDCYVDCASYKPEITHSTNVYVTTGKDYRKMFWSESDEKYPECNYTVVCETGYAAVSGTAPRCDAKTYMITLDKNGGSGDIADSVSCKFDSEECALPATSVLKRTGYNSVNKWCTNKDGTGKCYAAGEISKENISADASDMTLYAIWTPAVLKIELDTSTTEEGVTVENADQGPVYLKYETGWFSDADATQPITSIGTTLPNKDGYAFAGYKLNDVIIVDGAGTLVNSPAALTVTTKDATATVSWTATTISCEPGYYYPGTGSKCAVCKANHWCPGDGEFGTDNGDVGGLIKCYEGGLSNGGVDATNIGVCYKTGMSYQTFIDGDVKRNKAMGTWTCNYETAGYTDCHMDTLEINWCAGGYWYDESQTSIDCVVVGEDYWSEKGELVKHACPSDGGAIYGTRVTNGGNTNGATTSDSLTDCQMRMAYATTSNTAKGSYICIAEADGEVARYGNCRLDTVEINWCAGGYWYNEEFSTTDCQEVGNNWYSAEGDMTRNACPHGGTTDVTKASQPDGNCRKTVLHPGAKYNGPDVNGVGQRGCSYESGYDGYVYGDKVSDGYVYECAEVVMTQCDAGYWWQRGKEICEEVEQGFFGPVADPNNGNNKTGRMACPDNGLTDGTKSADATACYLEGLACDITNGTGKQTRYYDSAVVSGTAGYNACFANGQAVECDTMCTITGCDSGYSLVDGACINCPADHVCTPEEGKRSCADITGGTHVKSDAGTTDAAYCYAECPLDKNAYEMRGRDYYGAEVADTCEVVACSAGYTLSDGECVVCPAGMVCNPEIDGGMPKSCATLTGGEHTKSEPGADSINDCYMVCEPYDVVNGTAVPVQDSVNYPQECEYEGKSLNGNPCDIVDGVCVETSCNYNYEMDNGVCKPCAREHAVSYKKNGNCIVESCANGYHPNGTKCESDVVKCTAPNAVTATQTWNSKQNAFGPCVITSCEVGYHLGANTCQVDEQVCELEHGVGVREWNHNTNTWGKCAATKCDPGYTNDPSQTNELWEQCGRCNNMYGANGDLAVSSYVQGCEIAACMYQGEKYALEDNECHLICDTYSDDTGTRRWNEARKKCERVCEPGYTSW